MKYKRVFVYSNRQTTTIEEIDSRLLYEMKRGVTLNGICFEWVAYEEAKPEYDYILTYTQCDPIVFSELGETEVIYRSIPMDSICECGAVKLKHPGHSTWCRSYKETL